MLAPTLRFEQSLWDDGKLRVVGVDEVGRGPLAGPVLAAACLLPAHCLMIEGVRDSKQLTRGQREGLFPLIMAQVTAVGLGAASTREIERLNILRASHAAMRRALARIGGYDHALIDGNEIKNFDIGPHTAIVDGDAQCYAIACASIIAKVTRDRLMVKLGRRYPAYGWEHNAGYDTAKHREALCSAGVTPFHRRTYLPVRAVLDGSVSVMDAPQEE